jgi:DNA-binding NarL/FixJ family response regulator
MELGPVDRTIVEELTNGASHASVAKELGLSVYIVKKRYQASLSKLGDRSGMMEATGERE